MKNNERWIWAIGLVCADIFIFFLPVTAFAAAYILIVRPDWFRKWVDDIYKEEA